MQNNILNRCVNFKNLLDLTEVELLNYKTQILLNCHPNIDNFKARSLKTGSKRKKNIRH